jgi:large subunit ribosomal protein L29
MKKKISEQSSLTIDELKEEEKKLRKEIFNLRFQKATGEIENPMRVKEVKKNRARVLTIINEKKRKPDK